MATDLIRYDLLVQNALRGVVRKVLTDAARDGVPGEHHYYVSFLTAAPGVRISARLREKYPDEMTIVLQHQFWDLGVTEHSFEVGLAFGGIPERLLVPFEAVTGFFDPSVQFALKFEASAEEDMPEANTKAPKLANAEKDAGKSAKLSAVGTPALVAPAAVTPALAPPPPPVLLPKRATEPSADAEKQVKGKAAKAELAKSEPAMSDLPAETAKAAMKTGGAKDDEKSEKPAGAEVLSLDAFRKKS